MKPYVLVVDDFLDGREMVAEYLAFRGFTVVTATDGNEAIATAFASPPALILMDLTMPGLDGWEATRQLRGDPRTKDVLIVALTAHAFVEEQKRATLAGVDALIGKPFDMIGLGDAVESLLSQGRAGLGSLGQLALSSGSSRVLPA